MKNQNKIIRCKIFIIRFSIFNYLLLLFACDLTFVQEIDIDRLYFPPKLSVTAILNGGGSGVLDIRLMEGLSLADHQRLLYNNVRNGEIRMFEDGILILSIPGPFDMSTNITRSGDMWKWGRNGYRWISGGINTRPGSVYRLEVEVEGYPMAVSASVMPEALAVSASMDTSVQVIRKSVREIETVGYYLYHFGGFEYEKYPDKYWPFSVEVDLTGNFLVLDILKQERNDDRNVAYWWGIGASDVLILLEDGMDNELTENQNADLYLFSMLMTRNFKDAPRNFYAAVAETKNNPNSNDSHFENDPNFEKITTHHSLTLRVRNITPATYQYYRSLSLQSTSLRRGGVFAGQPVTVVGNIDGGYGSFAVYNTVSIQLLEWETFEYQKKEE